MFISYYHIDIVKVFTLFLFFFMFFKQKTSYEMRISDWSSDVCSSDLAAFALVSQAERIESELLAALSSVSGRDLEVEGTVRLATPEAFASHLIAPRVAALRERHPRLTLELASEDRKSTRLNSSH